MHNKTIGYAFCGSFCTFRESVNTLKQIKAEGYNIIPIMSFNAYSIDTRFGKACDFISEIEQICQNSIIHTIEAAEPIGPLSLLDALVIAPCTGNTTAKIALGITDTPVTMAAKAHLRNAKPLIIAIATNDALGLSGKNIGLLHSVKNIYYVPYSQDDPQKKATSIVADLSKLSSTLKEALDGKQIQPILAQQKA